MLVPTFGYCSTQKQYDVYWARNVLARTWWQAANGIYQMLLANRIFYPSYLAFKGLFINLKDRLQKNGPGPDYFPPAGAEARRTAQQK
jgi:hypothetical protein